MKSSNTSTITVEELMQLPAAAHLTLLSGKAGLSNAAENVTFAETLEGLHWCCGRDIIITKLSGIGTAQTREMFEALRRMSAAAVIVFYPEQCKKSTLKAVAALSEEYEIPVFTAGRTVRFTDVITPMLTVLTKYTAARSDFFAQLTSRRPSSAALNAAAAELGLSDGRRLCLLCIFAPDSSDEFISSSLTDFLPGAPYSKLRAGVYFAALPIELPNYVKSQIEPMLRMLSERDSSAVVCVGRVCTAPKELAADCALAMQLEQNRQLYSRFPRPLLLEKEAGLLHLIECATPALVEWSRDFLSPVLEYDEKSGDGTMFETLWLLCGIHQPSAGETARLLHIHPNTLTYRKKLLAKLLKLESIEESRLICGLAAVLCEREKS